MSRKEKTLPAETSGALRAQGMHEILPRHDLDLLTESRNFPEGDWLLSEVGRRHQFQASFCVPNQHGQLVPAPMAPVNISAVTSEEEVFQHCTVYQFSPSFQSRGNTEHSGAANQTSQQNLHHSRALPPTHVNRQQAPRSVQVAEQYRFDPDIKHQFTPQGEPAFFASPPSYESATAAAHPHTSRPEKEAGLSSTPIQGQNNFVSFSDASINEWPSHQQATISSDSFATNSFNESFRYSPASDEIRGLESFISSDFNTDIHGSVIIPSDSFDGHFTPAMLAQLDEHDLDDIFGQANDAGRDSNQRPQTPNDDHGNASPLEAPK